MTDQIEALLREDGARWRAEIDAYDFIRRSEPSPASSRRRLLPLAAAATVLAVVAAVLVAVGSGHHHDSSPAASSTAPSPAVSSTAPSPGPAAATAPASPDPLRPTLPAYARQLAAPQPVPLLSPAETRGLTSMPWILTGITSTGLEVLFVTGDGCFTPIGFEVVATDRAVTLVALSRDSDAAYCASARVQKRGIVRLDPPLARRALLHAPVAAEWALPPLR